MTPPPHAYFAAGDTSVGFTPDTGDIQRIGDSGQQAGGGLERK